MLFNFCKTATFGIKGVKENSIFMRSPEDVHQLRNRVLDCFEIASIPTVSEAEKKRLLSFLVVGGGPAGVEYAAGIDPKLLQSFSFLPISFLCAFTKVAQ